jgi:DNA-binding transcriptional MerR regulator
MLTISQLASFTGVTVRTVRHYHAKGLLPEPERDHSGYRRYDAAAAVELVRIRTLADSGVPLSRVRELLEADHREFAAAVEEIDGRLRVEIRERQRHRRRIAKLAAGESLALPPEVVAYLDRMRAIGLPQPMIEAERDAWILVAAQVPEHIRFYMEMKQQQLDDPATLQFLREMAAAISWEADDPRALAVADHLVNLLESADAAGGGTDPTEMTDELAQLLDSVFVDSVPIARRLMDLLEARGWQGWTKLERVRPPHGRLATGSARSVVTSP